MVAMEERRRTLVLLLELFMLDKDKIDGNGLIVRRGTEEF